MTEDKQPRKGHWIPVSPHDDSITVSADNEYAEYKCSECSQTVAINYPFCPYCGADMRKNGGERSYTKDVLIQIIEEALNKYQRPEESEEFSFWMDLLSYLKDGDHE